MAYPTLFRAEFVEQARKIAALGATDEQIADILDVGVRTLHRWKQEIPQFSDALRQGKAVADEEVKRSFYHRARSGDLQAGHWWLRSRCPEEFAPPAEPDRPIAAPPSNIPPHQSGFPTGK